MKNEEEYEKHLNEGWYFATGVAEKLIGKDDKDLQFQIAKMIFKLSCSPYHYFLQGCESEGHRSEPPTDKQVAYARKLGINNPYGYSKEELSAKIDEVRRG